MTIADLRAVHQARPYLPFVIHAADGRTFPIPHNEFLAYDPEGRTILALRTDGTFSILDLSLVTELEVLPDASKAGKSGN